MVVKKVTTNVLFGLFWFMPGLISGQSAPSDWNYWNTSNSGLPVNRVENIVFDQDGNLWAGTFNGGLAKYDGVEWTVYNTANSNIPGNNIRKLYTHDNIIWLVTHNGSTGYLLTRFDGSTWTTWSDFLTLASISFDSERFVWISTISDGLLKFDGQTIWPFNENTSCLYQDAVTASWPASPAQIWVGMYGDQFSGNKSGLVDMQAKGCLVYDKMNSGFPTDNWVHCIFPDPWDDNRIWINTNNGTARFDGETWEVFQHPASSGSAAAGLDSTGAFWIGTTFSGLGRYTDHWETFFGLPDFRINDLKISADNKVWVATESKGIAFFQNPITQINHMDNWPGVFRLVCNVLKKGSALRWTADYYFSGHLALYSPDGNCLLRTSLEGTEGEISLSEDIPGGIYFFQAKDMKKQKGFTGKWVLIQ